MILHKVQVVAGVLVLHQQGTACCRRASTHVCPTSGLGHIRHNFWSTGLPCCHQPQQFLSGAKATRICLVPSCYTAALQLEIPPVTGRQAAGPSLLLVPLAPPNPAGRHRRPAPPYPLRSNTGP